MTTFFDSIIMLRFSNAKVAKEECYWAKKKKKKIGMLMMTIYLTQKKLKRRIALSI